MAKKMTKKTVRSEPPPPPPPPPKTTHDFHPGHTLKLVAADDVDAMPFNCNGCKEPGAEARYACAETDCNLEMHITCALAKTSLKHRFFPGLKFKFLHKPTPAKPGEFTTCNACGNAVRGFVYHCSSPDLDLHPCCTRLPPLMRIGGVVFDLCNKMKKTGRRCNIACEETSGTRRRLSKFWAYRPDNEKADQFLHVACVKKVSHRELKAEYWRAHSKILGAKVPDLLLIKRDSSNSTKLFIKVAKFIFRVITGVISGDPRAMITEAGKLLFPGSGG